MNEIRECKTNEQLATYLNALDRGTSEMRESVVLYKAKKEGGEKKILAMVLVDGTIVQLTAYVISLKNANKTELDKEAIKCEISMQVNSELLGSRAEFEDDTLKLVYTMTSTAFVVSNLDTALNILLVDIENAEKVF